MEQKIGYIATKNFKQDKLIFEVGKNRNIDDIHFEIIIK